MIDRAPACGNWDAVSDDRTTVMIQRYLDALTGDTPAEPIVPDLLDRAVRSDESQVALLVGVERLFGCDVGAFFRHRAAHHHHEAHQQHGHHRREPEDVEVCQRERLLFPQPGQARQRHLL